MSADDRLSKPAVPVNPPVERGSTLMLASAHDLLRRGGRTYGRGGLATQEALKAEVMRVEGASACTLFPSGLAACAHAILGHVRTGDHLLVTDGCYLPTRRFCDRLLADFGVQTEYFAPREAAGLTARIKDNTRAIYLEQPSSLSFELHDLPLIARLARERDVVTIVDHSWGAGLACRPLALGVDLAVQSLTKYPSSASDVFCGSVCAHDPDKLAPVAAAGDLMGVNVSPDDAYLVLRGMRTLETRMQRHHETGLALARWLAERAEVSAVIHPALESHPDHQLYLRDFAMSSGVFGVVLRHASTDRTLAFFDALKVFRLGYSYGGFESLAILADGQLAARRHRPELDGPLVRLAAGLESVGELRADLEGALKAFAG